MLGSLGRTLKRPTPIKVSVKSTNQTRKQSLADESQKSVTGFSAGGSIHSASTRKIAASEKNSLPIDEDRRQMLNTLKRIRDYDIGASD